MAQAMAHAIRENGIDAGQQQGDAPQGRECGQVSELPTAWIPAESGCHRADMPSEIHHILLGYWLDECRVRLLLMLRCVNKAVQRRVDQHVLAIIKVTTEGGVWTVFEYVDADVEREPSSKRAVCARHMAVHWMALGCLSYVRAAEMCDKSIRRQDMRSFMYMMALRCFGKMASCDCTHANAFASITRALRHESQWYSKDGSERDALCRCVRVCVRARVCVFVCVCVCVLRV
jgi:hypothetical protein